MSRQPPSQASSLWAVELLPQPTRAHAEQLRANLQQQGHAATVIPVNVQGRTMYRLRVGPHISRNDSERLRQRLQGQTGIAGRVVPLGG